MTSAARRAERDARYDDVLAELRGPHEVGKPCPWKPWMMTTTLDMDSGTCGACGKPFKS